MAAAAPEAGRECGICYEPYRGAGPGGGPQLLPCRHSLCRRCLRRLLCRAAAGPFLSCPFCRMVTLLPEPGTAGTAGAPDIPDTVTPLGEQQQSSTGAVITPVPPVFAVSSSVSPCGSEPPPAFLLGLLGRGLLLDAQPPLASMENLRLAFAAGILVLIVSTFFLLVFLK